MPRRRAPNSVPPEVLERAAPGPAPSEFATRIVDWQRSHGRSELPWQNTRDPYRVWLSEVMLQQTQVSTVLGYFARFLARFPTVAALAAGSEDEVFGLWSGLGYYSRARNMHRCAQEVVARFGGGFPRSAAELQSLPGIGRSTAAAIAAFCFGERVAILDGNVKRVLTRLLAFDGDMSSAAQERLLWNRATGLLPPADDPEAISRYTQGVMDLGATVCVPRKPSCMICPVSDLCLARRLGAPERFPVKTRKLRRSSASLWLLLARDAEDRVWLQKRPARGIWAGLHCLPVYDSREALVGALPEGAGDALTDAPAFLHVLTHKDLHLHPVLLSRAGTAPMGAVEGAWFEADAWRVLGLPAPVRKLLGS
ncbi:A/G-specific adenine glycosylase [Variovorax sp. J22P168]|uniref:A/G-specific adenine glycosylase n=1 Tax=Variovorax jilinensis TaxID=3053513 RepID=UPI00257549BD|nr:A/G-specific adenine glycosylase [Variovorax sp. J22P168]MDM0012445.1 A/G-specific adenine glycosylase [Variovorax sp. J22P168]